MTAPTVTYPSFTSGSLIESAKINQNYQDILSACTDSSKAFSVSSMTVANTLTVSKTTNQLVLGTTNQTTISAVAPAASRVVSLQDPGADADFVTTKGAQTIAGVKTFSDTTDSTTKDTGCVVLEGGLGVEKNIVLGGYIASGSLEASTSSGAVNLFQPVSYAMYTLVIHHTSNATTKGMYFISGDSVNGWGIAELHDSASVITIDYSGGYIRMDGGNRTMRAAWIRLI